MRNRQIILAIIPIIYIVFHVSMVYKSGWIWKDRLESEFEELLPGVSTCSDIENILQGLEIEVDLHPYHAREGANGGYYKSLRGIVTRNPLSLILRENLRFGVYTMNCIFVGYEVYYFKK